MVQTHCRSMREIAIGRGLSERLWRRSKCFMGGFERIETVLRRLSRAVTILTPQLTG